MNKLRFLIALFCIIEIRRACIVQYNICILEELEDRWNLKRFGDLLTSWLGESAASTVFRVRSLSSGR